MEIGYCLDCNEISYAVADRNQFDMGKLAFNHDKCRSYVFERPELYSPPIRNILCKLQAGLPITNMEISFFKLAIDMGDLDSFFRAKKLIGADEGFFIKQEQIKEKSKEREICYDMHINLEALRKRRLGN